MVPFSIDHGAVNQKLIGEASYFVGDWGLETGELLHRALQGDVILRMTRMTEKQKLNIDP